MKREGKTHSGDAKEREKQSIPGMMGRRRTEQAKHSGDGRRRSGFRSSSIYCVVCDFVCLLHDLVLRLLLLLLRPCRGCFILHYFLTLTSPLLIGRLLRLIVCVAVAFLDRDLLVVRQNWEKGMSFKAQI